MLGSIFNRTRSFENALLVDIHSHLLPGLDDGVKTFEEAIEILRVFAELGYKKVITTPHIRKEFFPNTAKGILERWRELQQVLAVQQVGIQVEAAAEYFIDEHLLEQIKKKRDLLTFGDGYLLVETSFYSRPIIADEVIFELKAAGYKPILAHPERYEYFEAEKKWFDHHRRNGLLFQLNLASLVGGYGAVPKKVAKNLIKEGEISFLGSDLHRPGQLERLRSALFHRHTAQAIKGGLKNNELL